MVGLRERDEGNHYIRQTDTIIGQLPAKLINSANPSRRINERWLLRQPAESFTEPHYLFTHVPLLDTQQ